MRALLLALPLLLSGCLTPALWDAYEGPPAETAPAPPGPERLDAAVRTTDGAIHVSALYGDGQQRHLRYDPALGDELRPQDGPLPRGDELWVARVGLEPPHGTRRQVRLRGDALELSDGRGFQLLARFPAPPRAPQALPSSPARGVLGGVALGVATPFTVALDVAGGATLIALSPVLVPILMVW